MEDSILEKIYRSVLKFLVPLTPEETYKIVVEEALKLVNGDDGAVLLAREGELVKVYSSSEAIASVKRRKKGFAYTAFRKKKAFMVDTEEVLKAHPESKTEGVRSLLFIPLSYEDKTIGVLVIRSFEEGPKFTKKELEILKLFGSFVSLNIRKTELFGETAKALEIRDKFISMASHELRTPITSIYGYAQLLNMKLGKSQNQEAKWAAQLFQECMRLTQLIDELMAANRLAQGKFIYDWQECDIREILNRSLNRVIKVYPEREFIFLDKSRGKEVKIIGDFSKLCQAFSNIFDNAAKFSLSNSKIKIILISDPKNIQITTKDEGLGISGLDLPNIGSRFYVGTNHSREGLGLGLYLAKDIVKNHHGKLDIRSVSKVGTQVSIKLPRYD